MQYKHPTSSHTRKQAQFPSSMRKNKSGFSYETPNSSSKKGKVTFEQTLDSTLAEGIGEISFVTPEILNKQPDTNQDDCINQCIESLTNVINCCGSMLSTCQDEQLVFKLQDIIENCTNQLNSLENLNGPA